MNGFQLGQMGRFSHGSTVCIRCLIQSVHNVVITAESIVNDMSTVHSVHNVVHSTVDLYTMSCLQHSLYTMLFTVQLIYTQCHVYSTVCTQCCSQYSWSIHNVMFTAQSVHTTSSTYTMPAIYLAGCCPRERLGRWAYKSWYRWHLPRSVYLRFGWSWRPLPRSGWHEARTRQTSQKTSSRLGCTEQGWMVANPDTAHSCLFAS